MELELTKEQRQAIVTDIQRFFQEERDEEIGIVAAEAVLAFFLESTAARIYNAALDTAKTWLTRRVEDLGDEFDQLYQHSAGGR